MDLATVIGLLLGWGAVLAAAILEGTELAHLVNVSAFVLVIGGTFGATMVGFPLKKMIGLAMVTKNAFFGKAMEAGEMIKQIVNFARKARRDGILALEDEARKLDNRLLQTGVQLIVDGTPEEAVRGILETEVLSMQERHGESVAIFNAMGGFAPTMGVIGTVMGLVHMLGNLSDPGKMGPMIAAAFIATLYGVAFANLLFLPIGQKLKAKSAEEVAVYEMMIEGILSIQAGDNPRLVETKMMAFCSPKLREGLNLDESSE